MAIVDDDEGMRNAMRRVLETEGFPTQIYASAEAFLVSGAASQVACVVLDIRLPGMSGIELHEWLAGICGSLPTVFVTAHDDLQVRRLADKGFGCLVKPFHGEALVQAVVRAIAA